MEDVFSVAAQYQAPALASRSVGARFLSASVSSRAVSGAPTLAFCTPVEGVTPLFDGFTFSGLWWNPLPTSLLCLFAIRVSLNPAL